VAITHPAGDPERPADRELALRVALVSRALETLQMRLERAQVFEPAAA
jgi:hypothetical protein